jgi:glycerol uptake facilitator-like aquaporin
LYSQLKLAAAASLQFSGAIFGALLVAGLVPGAYVGMGDGAPGCFDSTIIGKDLTPSQLFGWEVGMTFTLLSVVYACGVAKPGHGSFTPLAVGLSLVACAGTGRLLISAQRLQCSLSTMLMSLLFLAVQLALQSLPDLVYRLSRC